MITYALTTDVIESGVTFKRGMTGDTYETWADGRVRIIVNVASGIHRTKHPVTRGVTLRRGQYVRVGGVS